MNIWSRLFCHKIKPTIKTFKKSANKRIVYISVGTCLRSFSEELDRQWNSNCFCVSNLPPKTPYAKILMQIIELNEQFDHERK